jgi:hypothetical protein
VRRAYGRDIWAGSREIWQEHARVFAVVAEARLVGPNAIVAAGKEERHAAGAELCELLADAQGVGLRDALLIVAVRGADYLGDGGEAEDVVYPDEIGLIRVG